VLKRRLLTSLAGIPIVIAAIWFDSPVAWFPLFVTGWGVMAVMEFYRITSVTKVRFLTVFGTVWTALVIINAYFNNTQAVPILIASGTIVPLIWCLSCKTKEGAFSNWTWTMGGILYVGLLLSYFVALRHLDTGFNTMQFPYQAGRAWVYFAIFITFGNDTAAFFVGRAFGKHPLAPHISPKKTWEGAIGGVGGTIVGGFILLSWLHLPVSIPQLVVMSIIVSVMGQFGDLVESLFKRNMAVKDSSNLLPGHGGFLDRIDSMTFVGVTVYYFVLALNAGWLKWL
jgi:phosphatidate cytidylyltransferase